MLQVYHCNSYKHLYLDQNIFTTVAITDHSLVRHGTGASTCVIVNNGITLHCQILCYMASTVVWEERVSNITLPCTPKLR